MTLVPSTAASAVYHDALSTARGFRTLCFLVLLLCLVGQIALFFTARYGNGLIPVQGTDAAVTAPTGASVSATSATSAADAPDANNGQFGGEAGAGVSGNVSTETVDTGAVAPWLYAILYVTLWAGLVFSILLCLDLLFTTLVMLNGRTVGVGKVAKAFLWSLLLLMLVMPWQSILNHPTLRGGIFHLPGVLYTWPELNGTARPDSPGALFPNSSIIGWLRFVVWPVVALVLLLVVFGRSGTGIKEALGEDLPDLNDEPLDRPVS